MYISFALNYPIFDDINVFGWFYYLSGTRCLNNGWHIIAQECLCNIQASQRWPASRYKDAGDCWNFEVTDFSPSEHDDLIIPDSIINDIIRNEGSLSSGWTYLETKEYAPLKDTIEAYVEKMISEGKKIDAFLAYPRLCKSLSVVAEKYDIPVFLFEVGSLRPPVYRGLSYLSLNNILWSSPNEFSKQYDEFCQETSNTPVLLLDNRSLLALFLSDEYLPCLRLYNAPALWNVLIAGSICNTRFLAPEMQCDDFDLITSVKASFGNDFIFRPDPGDVYTPHYKLPGQRIDRSAPNVLSILKSRCVASLGGNILLDVILWGRQVYCHSPIYNLYPFCDHDLKSSSFQFPPAFISFLFIGYHLPMEQCTIEESLRYYLEGHTVLERYNKNLDYYLSQIGLDQKTLAASKDPTLCILERRGRTDVAEPLLPKPDESISDFWARVELVLGFKHYVCLEDQLENERERSAALSEKIKDMLSKGEKLENEQKLLYRALEETKAVDGQLVYQIEESQKAIELIYRSTSWRITKPFRAIKRILTKNDNTKKPQ